MDREFVDLGLSVKWATMNIGAGKIVDPGSYFAWGETKNKEDYTWDAYQHGASADDLTKYNGFYAREERTYTNLVPQIEKMI